ncbi:uncharacterized protein LOC112510957 [Cynara cardunculus var. scolymus]|uniref:Uncharacterized protein n=1 Tax=Cynara cardunculus var. scolymus TaxID=59895 RepID=A0A103XWF4_CYNCS|nr:uncharacterized protein LOC112510957 [Cynara cardunculus var. scolymus]KVH98150.1 hypothetical protein Ccrd_023631 [Cynara cardunculus var. scolymus]
MDFNGPEPIHQQEDRECLLMNTYGGIPSVKVVEYMLSSMSNELLCKFPDNSAFDFDYTQSSIWSPLVPHPSNPSSPAPDLQRKLSYDDDEHGSDGMVWHSGDTSTAAVMMKKLTANIKDKIADSCVFSCFRIHPKIGKKKMVMMKRRRNSFRGFDQLGPISSDSSGVVADSGCSSPNQRKGWKKVLKAASKQFKKTMKKKESGVHLKLSNGFSHFSC